MRLTQCKRKVEMSHMCKVEVSHFPSGPEGLECGVGWALMSERELNPIEVLSQVSEGCMTAATTATVLDLSRQKRRKQG